MKRYGLDPRRTDRREGERGNMLFIILLAVVLLGLLTAAISQMGGDSAEIDDESLAIKASEVQRFFSELERAVLFITENGKSEQDIRFSHANNHADYGDLDADADKSDQVFHVQGGGATYKLPPPGINDGSKWEFYGNTAIPAMGSDRADLVAVLPNVTLAACRKFNRLNGLMNGATVMIPQDTSVCVHSGAAERFDNATQYDDTPNTMNEATFPQNDTINKAKPAPEACVECTGAKYHIYHVLLAR